MTPFISTQNFFLSLADKLQFNAFYRAGLQATTCRLESIRKRNGIVYFHRRFTANGIQIQEICQRAPVFLLSRADTFVQTAIYSQWRPDSGNMSTKTSFLIKSGRHFRTNRNLQPMASRFRKYVNEHKFSN